MQLCSGSFLQVRGVAHYCKRTNLGARLLTVTMIHGILRRNRLVHTIYDESVRTSTIYGCSHRWYALSEWVYVLFVYRWMYRPRKRKNGGLHGHVICKTTCTYYKGSGYLGLVMFTFFFLLLEKRCPAKSFCFKFLSAYPIFIFLNTQCCADLWIQLYADDVKMHCSNADLSYTRSLEL